MSGAPPLPATVAAYQVRARELLAGPHWDGLFSEQGDRMWLTNQANVAAFERWTLCPRVLTGNAAPSLATSALGHELALPVAVAPSAAHQRVCPEGELATVRGAGRAGTLTVLSTLSDYTIEEVAAAATGPLWLQLYILRERERSLGLVRRAESAGFAALVVSVDNVAGRPPSRDQARLYDLVRHPAPVTSQQPHRAMSNFADLSPERRPGSLMDAIDPALSWRDIGELRRQTSLPVVLKGVQTAEDAHIAREEGIRAIVVSNHGGVPMELEGLRPTLDALPEVVEAAAGEVEVYLDGGVRTGRDVLKALALGARLVLTGRPIQWGLAVGGEDGAHGVIDTLGRELTSIMGICGVADVRAVPRALLARAG